MTLSELKKLAEKATTKWESRTERLAQVGYELEGYFASGPYHRDNPRKDHFEKASNDSKFIFACSPDRILELIALVEEARGHVENERNAYVGGADAWLERLKRWEEG